MAAARRIIRDLVNRNNNNIRHLRDRSNPLEELSAHEVKERYRFYLETIIFLVQTLNADLERPTLRSSPLPVLLQVCVALRFLATGSFLITVGDTVGSVSKSTVSRVVKHFIHSVIRRLGWKIAFPRGEEARRVKDAFFEIAGKFYPSITQTCQIDLKF